MKTHLLTVAILFLGISIDAQTIQVETQNFSKKSDLVITQNQIRENGKLIGKFEVKKKESTNLKKEKLESYEVEISGNDGVLVADYEVTINKDEKNNKLSVKDAQMKTIKDRVTHNGANFLDYTYAQENGDSEIPQLKKAIKYLISYDYL